MPSLNWFTLNRVDGSPSYFGNVNRLSASFYWNDWLYGVVITAAAFITVLLLLSPIYKHQWRTISLVTTSILMGGAFVLALVMPWWQTLGPVQIQAPIRVQDKEPMDLILEVHIGLDHVNITLVQASIPQQTTPSPSSQQVIVLPRLLPRDSQAQRAVAEKIYKGEVRFNEQIQLTTADEMRDQLRSSLERGLPEPILTVVSYLSHQEEGFRWSVDFRKAGYICQFVLTLTLICWAWMNIFFLVIPQHGAIAMITTGFLALLAVFLYWILLPAKQLVININGSELETKLDGCYWTVLTTGLVALITGTVLLAVEIRHPGSLTFDLEIDSEFKIKLIDKVVERRSVKLRPSSASVGQHKLSLKSRISVMDATAAGAFTEATTINATHLSNKDSGLVSTIDSGMASVFVSRSHSDSDQIATLDGSYLKSTVTNFIQEEGAPKIYSYTFRQGRELPSFHESTISLHSETVPRFLDSIVEEDQVIIHRSADEGSPPSPLACESVSHHSPESSDKEEWQDPLENSVGSDELNETFCSTYTTTAKIPSPRRRPSRALSIGSHRDIIGNS